MTDDWEPLELLDEALAQLLDAPPPDAALPLAALDVEQPSEHADAAQAPKKRRKRPKDELIYLRERVEQLTAELAAAREAVRASFRRREGEEGCGASEWEELATRQKLQVDEAMATNALLRATLEGQIELAKQLHATLQRHAKMARISALPPVDNSQVAPNLFGNLTQRLQGLHSRLDQVMEATEFTPSEGKMRVSTLTSDGGCVYFALSDARRLPFSVEDVHQAQWRGISHDGSKNLHGTARLVEKDMYYFSFTRPIPTSAGESVNVKGQLAIRRFVEETRVAMVWAGMVEIDGSMYVRVREDGWGITSAADNRDKHLTLMRNLAHVTPEVADVATVAHQRAHVGEMTDLVLDVYRRQVAGVTQAVENMLFASLK